MTEIDANWKMLLWKQFGAAIDMLAGALDACPAGLWEQPIWPGPEEEAGYAKFWYLGYHSLFWLDFYLTGVKDGFTPPKPFTLSEFDYDGYPERVYAKDELLAYLDYGRSKCRETIAALTDESAWRVHRFPWGELPFAELLLYNLRHVQEHASQLGLCIGQHGLPAPGWVGRAKEG